MLFRSEIFRNACIAFAAGLLLAPAVALAGAKIEIGEDSYLTVGMGLRTSYTSAEDAAPSDNDYSNDFDLENWRLYMGGQILPHVFFEFNADYDGGTENDLQVLDGIIKFEFNDLFNIWAGRFLPPSDRSNLSGPFYLNTFDFPFVQQYPNIFAGRDEGAAIWGQVGEGAFKWQFGAFEGIEEASNDSDNLLFAGRLVLNLWDPEPGYYNASTYYGEKDVLAIGLVGQYQQDAVGTGPSNQGDFEGWNIDFLMEKKLDLGVVSLEGAYYDYDRDDFGSVTNEGTGWFALASILLPPEVGPDGWKGKFQPFVRYQEFDPELSGEDDHERLEFGIGYVLRGHNARITATYSQDDAGSNSSTKNIFKLGLQFQL